MELDQSFLAELPLQHRQQVCRQLRQKQVEKYLQFEKSDRGREPLPRKKETRKVNFSDDLLLQNAVDNFDDREVAKYLCNGCDPNVNTGNGTSLLHRCAADDNVSAAELFIAHGADVNILDDDWWTPLHTACSCDCPEIASLLVSNGADMTAMDVDGYFPIDLAGDGTEVKAVMTKLQETEGLTESKLYEKRQDRAKEFLKYIKGLPLAIDINKWNKQGVTMLHIAAANGYRSCLKALFRYNADVNRQDDYGWTPLHVAARFNQERAVRLLLKNKANPNQEDMLGSKPSAVTSSDTIRALLMKCERKQKAKDQPMYLEISDDSDDKLEGNVYEEIKEIDIEDPESEPQVVGVFRINSKAVRAKRITISKEDELQEAKKMYESVADFNSGGVPVVTEESETTQVKDHKDDGDYVSMAIWRASGEEKGHLALCMGSDNMISLPSIKEEKILMELQRRFGEEKQIYTLIGDVLVAVNPFHTVSYYTKEISLQYHTAGSNTHLPPHIYTVAERSYRQLVGNQTSQCHVISGESGAGKSESCKYIIQHILRVAGSEETNLNTKINQVNPLLEAFGNAVTVMNDNSSRFGKYVELSFDNEGKVCGAKISQYMLEKSRVVHQGKDEQNFHIFCWMMAGLAYEETRAFKLEHMEKFRYLKSCMSKDQVTSENKAKFWEVKESLKYIGFSTTDIQNVMETLSIVLHVGEIDFHGVGNNDAAQVLNTDMLNTVSEMLEVSAEELRSALVADYTVTRGEQIKKERTVEQATACRDALAKSLYARLFSWIVNGINQFIQPMNELGEYVHLGILDIFGFENFSHNSFEQICINVANEQIQLFTNDHIFQTEQQDCLLEGVPLIDLDYNNNQPILNVFLEKHTGLLAILDEESNFPKATDKSLATKLHQNTGKKHGEFYKTPRDGGLSFTVVHYAGCVQYDVTGILEKNRDTLPNSILYTMKTSNRLLLKELFQSRVTRTGSLAPSARQQRSRRTTVKKSSSPFEFFKKFKANKKEDKKAPKHVSVEKKGPSTMAYHFRNSLNDLITKLQSSSPHFIRCIKPNSTKSAFMFVPEYVLAQLRYTGISEIAKIRKFGYALRLSFHEFLSRYKVLVKCCLPVFCPMTDIQKCKEVVNFYKLENVQFGKTKIFLKSTQADRLDQLTADLETKVTKAQAVVRGFLGRQQTKKLSAARDEIRRNKAVILDREQAKQVEKSLSTLDDIIQGYDKVSSVSRDLTDDDDVLYDDAFSIEPISKVGISSVGRNLATEDAAADDDDDALYDDAFSIDPSSRGGNTVEEDDMNGQLQRGLPPTPSHGMHFDSSRPPPTPKEMYSQGMYASIDDQIHYENKKHAPPPPKRNPDTRLSTTSVGGMYEEIHVQEHPGHYPQQPHGYGNQPAMHGSPAHHIGYHQQQHSYGNQSPVHTGHGSPPHQTGYHQHHQSDGNQSPRHTAHGSPVLKSKAGHEPQSPSMGMNKPFSYGAPLMSPKLHHAMEHNVNRNIQTSGTNGHSQQNVPNLTNYEYSEQGTGSPVMSYGKHESAFHPQSHRPPPCGPPPPVPPGHQGHRVTAPQPQYPQSPTMQRHSVSTIQGSVHRPNIPGSPKVTPKLSMRSKSMPCEGNDNYLHPVPPPPLPARDGYVNTVLQPSRSPSPPLPPPPPELLMDYIPPQQQQMFQNVSHSMGPQHNQSLPQSTVLTSPRQQPGAPAAPPPPPVSSIPRKRTDIPSEMGGAYPSEPSRPHHAQSVSPPRIPKESSPDQAALLQEIGKIQLKKTDSFEGERTTAGPMRRMSELSTVKLRQTSARLKLLEKDGIKTAAEEPPPEPVPAPQEETPPPQPAPVVTPQQPPQAPQQTQVTPAVSLFEKKVEMISKGDNKFKKQGNDSTMDISIENIDLDDVPGYTPITKSTPIWKRDMIEKKNQEKIEEYIENIRRQKEEEEKWRHVPAWKRKLMMEKSKEKEQRSKEEIERAAQEEADRKRRDRKAEEERKARLREQKEMERQMDEEMQELPAWKREIMMKRGGAIRNWADEREEANEQEMEEQGQGEMGDNQQNVFTQKATLVLKEPPPDAPPQTSPQQQSNRSPSKSSKVVHDNHDVPPPQPTQIQSKKVSPQKTPVVSQNQTKEPEVKKSSPRKSLDETKLEEEWESLPLWKREIMMKRGGAPSNWGDEREEVNEEDEDNAEQ